MFALKRNCQKNCQWPIENLLIAVESGFNTSLFDIEIIQEYMPFRESYYIHDGVIMYHDCPHCSDRMCFRLHMPLTKEHQAWSGERGLLYFGLVWQMIYNVFEMFVVTVLVMHLPKQLPHRCHRAPPIRLLSKFLQTILITTDGIFWLLGIDSQVGLTHSLLFRVRAPLVQLH